MKGNSRLSGYTDLLHFAGFNTQEKELSKTDEHVSDSRLAEIAFKDGLRTEFEKAHIEDCVGCLKALVDAMHDIIRRHESKEKKRTAAGKN